MPSWASRKTSSSETLRPRAPRERLGLQAVGALAGELAGAALVLDHAHVLAGLGHAVEAEHLDGLAGQRRA